MCIVVDGRSISNPRMNQIEPEMPVFTQNISALLDYLPRTRARKYVHNV